MYDVSSVRQKGVVRMKSSKRTRGEVLSVKASAIEKDMIIRAAATLGITYSEFVRAVAMGACRKLGIEEDSLVTPDDVRRRPGGPRRAPREDAPRRDSPVDAGTP